MNGKSPDAFRTISEVADWLGVNTHVLRFWESKFTQVKPVKRAGGRRYYRPADMELLGGIQKLLHEDGMTIKGVQKVLRDQGVKAVVAMSKPVDDGEDETTSAAAVAAEPVAPEHGTRPQQADAEQPDEIAQGVSSAPETSLRDLPRPSHDAEPPAEAAPAPTEPETAPEVTVPMDATARRDPMPLFSHHEEAPADPVPPSASEPDTTVAAAVASPPEAGLAQPPAPHAAEETPPRQSNAAVEDGNQESTAPAPSDAPPDAADGPIIAPLPAKDLTLVEALERLVPLQIPHAELVPIHARLTALRDRMDAAA